MLEIKAGYRIKGMYMSCSSDCHNNNKASRGSMESKGNATTDDYLFGLLGR